ncbi:MAG: helix-turn-helix domain-containing protein [Thomasclavelia sp.]
MVIYKRIRDLREDKDLTQKDLANYLNVSQKSYIRDMNRGERTIAPEILSKIATFR